MSWTYLGETKPQARKQYFCDLCGLAIAQGERHVARSGVMDGQAETQRMHMDCNRMTIDWTVDNWETDIDAGQFRKDLAQFLADEAASGAAAGKGES